jgi:hypothetical protein
MANEDRFSWGEGDIEVIGPGRPTQHWTTMTFLILFAFAMGVAAGRVMSFGVQH